jgi:hypothetical protein
VRYIIGGVMNACTQPKAYQLPRNSIHGGLSNPCDEKKRLLPWMWIVERVV